MLSIKREIWEQIEPQLRSLMVAAFDAGFDAGVGAPVTPARDRELGQLLDDTRRQWAEGLAVMESWRQAYLLPMPEAPAWLEELRTEN